jgi:hypothetical protein
LVSRTCYLAIFSDLLSSVYSLCLFTYISVLPQTWILCILKLVVFLGSTTLQVLICKPGWICFKIWPEWFRLNRKQKFDYYFPWNNFCSHYASPSGWLPVHQSFIDKRLKFLNFTARLPWFPVTKLCSYICMFFLWTQCFSAWLLSSWPFWKSFDMWTTAWFNFSWPLKERCKLK